MKIDGGASYLFASQHANNTARMDAKASFDALLTEKTDRSERTASTTAAPAEIEQTDFTNMTRQELRDWMSEQLRSGEMTVDESKAFLGWVVDIRIDQNGRVISGGNDDRLSTERFNFFDLVRGNRDFYLQRGDIAAADRIQGALDLMERSQGQITRFDARI